MRSKIGRYATSKHQTAILSYIYINHICSIRYMTRPMLYSVYGYEMHEEAMSS